MKKLLQLFALLMVMRIAFVVAGCSNGNSNSTDDNTTTQEASSSDDSSSTTTVTDIFTGTFTGSIVVQSENPWASSQTLYITVTAASNSYNVKAWTNEEKTGASLYTYTGTYTITGNTVSGSGSGSEVNEHTMAGTTTDNGTTWSLSLELSSGETATGTITKQ